MLAAIKTSMKKIFTYLLLVFIGVITDVGVVCDNLKIVSNE